MTTLEIIALTSFLTLSIPLISGFFAGVNPDTGFEEGYTGCSTILWFFSIILLVAVAGKRLL